LLGVEPMADAPAAERYFLLFLKQLFRGGDVRTVSVPVDDDSASPKEPRID
jgi:hypothetical protein